MNKFKITKETIRLIILEELERLLRESLAVEEEEKQQKIRK